MGASWALLGRSWALLCTSWLLVDVLGWFFHVWVRSGLVFGGFGTHPGRFLEAPIAIFPRFWAHAALLFAQAPDTQKPKKNIGFY